MLYHFKHVPDLCFIGLIAVLGKLSTIIDHSAPVEKYTIAPHEGILRRADGRMLPNVLSPSFAIDKHLVRQLRSHLVTSTI